MPAFAVVGLQKRLARLLVVPRLVGRARFHGREDADQTGVIATPGQYFLHPIFLAEVPFADELDLHVGFAGQLLGVLPQLVAERLGKARIIKNPHLALVKVGGHPGSEADLRQSAENQHPVPAAQHTGDLGSIPFRQQFDGHPPS